MSKKEQFKRNRAALQIDEDWESIADEIAKERDILRAEIEQLKGTPSEVVTVDPKKCINWLYSDRNDFELGDIDELASDIKRNGQLQPAIIRKLDSLDEKYEVIAGERRWRACSEAGIPLKAIITTANDGECLVIQTSENKKESLSAYSLSKVYSRLMKDKNISQNKLAEMLGVSKGAMSNILAFNKVHDDIWKEVGDMSKVSSKTAGFIAAQLSRGEEYLDAFKALAPLIRDGRGEQFLEKSLSKFFSNKQLNRNRTYVQKSSDGKVLFRITEQGRITLGESVRRKFSIDEIKDKLLETLDV